MGIRRAAAVVAAGVMVMTMTGVVLLPGLSWAKTPLGSGTYSCSVVAIDGRITLNRPWSDTGKGVVKATVSATIPGCTGGSPSPGIVTVSGKLTFPNGGDGCSNGSNGTAKLKLTYSSGVKKSTFTGSFFADPRAMVSPAYADTVIGSYPLSGATLLLGGGEYSGQCSTGITSLEMTQAESYGL
jgi:hypothetical protein